MKSIPKIWDEVQLEIPSRIHMALFNDERIGLWRPWWWSISIAIDAFKIHISIKVVKSVDQVCGIPKDLSNHIINVFCNAIKTNRGEFGFKINVLRNNVKHIWFWNSVWIFLWIILWLNALYGYQLTNNQIRKLIWYNYVEYEDNYWLVPWYETWGWPACMLYWWLAILTDSLEIIDCVRLDNKYKVLCFLPSKFYQWTKNVSRSSFSEKKVFEESRRFSALIPATSNKVFYDLIPAIKNKDMISIWNIVEDLNYMMGNIWTIRTRYSSSYFLLFEKIKRLWWIITWISSTWPTVYVVATQNKLNYILSQLHNDIDKILWIYDISTGFDWFLNKHPIKKNKFPNLQKF